MAVDVLDFAKRINFNRMRLINILKKYSLNIDDNSTFDDIATSVSNVLTNWTEGTEIVVPNKHTVRWINITGDVIRTDYVEDGASITPPDPSTFNCDPDYLEFDNWTTTSDITNVTKDIDCGTIYKTKADSEGRRWTYIFCNLISSIGLTVTIPYNKKNNAAIMLIDWGDGSELEQLPTDSYTGLKSHTYQKDGHYTIKVWCDYSDWVFNTEPPNYLLGTQDMTNCVYKMFLGDNISSSKRLQLNSAALKYVSIPNSSTITSFSSEFFNGNTALQCIIFPKNITSSYNFRSNCFKNVVLNQGLTKVGGYMFAYSAGRFHLTLPDGLKEISNNLFNISSGQIGTFIEGSLTIPSSVTSIGSSAFAYSRLSDLKFEKNSALSGIGSTAFAYSCSPKSLDLTQFSNLKSIAGNAFAYSPISSLNVKIGITLDTYAFSSMYYLEDLILYDNFDTTISLAQSPNLSLSTLYNIANWLKDNTDLTSKKIIFSKYLQSILSTNYINSFGELTTDSSQGVSLLEYMQNKNWTVSFST